jgi:hypothetical protein
MNCGRFCRRLFPMSFCHPRHNPTEKFFSRTSFQSRCVYHMKIANIHVGTIFQNVRIALQFSYQFAIFISVCNSHFLVVPTWTFAIFIWVCNFHISLQFSYQFAILTSRLQNFLHTRLQMDSHVTMNVNS